MASARGLSGLKKKRRIQIVIVAFVALIIAGTAIGYALRDGISFFRSPSEVLAETPLETERFRLGGLVKEGSIVPREGMHFDFIVHDGVAEVPVRYIGKDPKPDLFKEGTGTIATGYLKAGVFEAEVLLAKHDEKYMPKEVSDSLKAAGVWKEGETPSQ